ncbi:MAG TPA: 4Fe-4S dicluster domain-containing protein [Bacteroidales bacterium]|nr:4Fe-4S dicluster domain-containing protein [Bacteroidales bacterium]
MYYLTISKEDWDKSLGQLLLSGTIYAPVQNEFGQDYELLKLSDIQNIIYNKPKPATPLKNFFLPIKENVTSERDAEKPRIIMGIPNCDIEALNLTDEIYLDDIFNDLFYRKRRENTILISSDCFGIQEHCHCLSYDIRPYAMDKADMSVIRKDEEVILRVISSKGEELAKKLSAAVPLTDKNVLTFMESKQIETENLVREANKGLPDYKKTGVLVQKAEKEVWEKYSSNCVSCGACTTICPTCTCFLLIDKPGFEKVKQVDACQYPGFERVAGGEDALFELHNRFKNRYMCKYVWKPQKFKAIACTGCGRCIEACIGKINKNELFMELV